MLHTCHSAGTLGLSVFCFNSTDKNLVFVYIDFMFRPMRRFKQQISDAQYIEILKNALPRVQCLELKIEHMTGKLVNES